MTAQTNITSVKSATLANKLTLGAMTLALQTLASPTRAEGFNPGQGRWPELPSPTCDKLEVSADYELRFHVYALGVQIYQWNGAGWVFIGPEAALFADAGYRGQVGSHYAGPTWEANDGSKVVAARVDGCAPSSAIPWLLLGAVSTSDHGLFANTTFIQRVNTVGGTVPTDAGQFVGDEARVPYSAEYFFYYIGKD
jgi:hypothetical protein